MLALKVVESSHDSSEPSHVAEEETQVISPGTKLLSKGITTAEGIFTFPSISFPIENIDDVLIICLGDLSQRLLLN